MEVGFREGCGWGVEGVRVGVERGAGGGLRGCGWGVEGVRVGTETGAG